MTTLNDSDLRGLGYALGRYTQTCPDPNRAHNMAAHVSEALDLAGDQLDLFDLNYTQGRVVSMSTDQIATQLDLANVDEADIDTLPDDQRRFVSLLLAEYRARTVGG